MKINFVYKGKLLKEYCLENNLNYRAIIARIYSLMENKVFSNLNSDQIMEIAIENYTKRSKYNYDGQSLKQYCESHGLSFATILSRINSLKARDDYRILTDDEIIDMAINDYKRKGAVIYKGISLSQYCTQNGLNYKKILSDFKLYKATNQFKELDDEQLLEFLIENNYRKSKYLYHGIPLKDYCDQNGISSSIVYSRIYDLKRKEKYKGMSEEEILEVALNGWVADNVRYIYKGEPLTKYCNDNNLIVSTVYSRIRSLQMDKRYKDYTDDEIVEMAVNHTSRKTKYFYKGISLKEYCEKNNLKYESVIYRVNLISSKAEYSSLSEDEIIELALDYKKNSSKYFYKGISLSEFCRQKRLDVHTLYKKIRTYGDELSEQEKVNLAVESILSRKTYTYKGIKVSKYCKENALNYNRVMSNFYGYINKGYEENDAMEKAISKDKNKFNNDKLNLIYEDGKLDKESIIKLCENLNIDYKNLMLLARNLGLSKAIKLVWYFGRKEKGLSKIESSDLTDVYNLAEIAKGINDCEYVVISVRELYDLYRLYKCSLVDTSKYIVNFIKKQVSSISDENIIKIIDDINVNDMQEFQEQLKKTLKTMPKKIKK